MNIVGLDTSTQNLVLIILKDGQLVSEGICKGQRDHSANLLPLFEKTLKKSGLTLDQIDHFAIGLGPGSFTGLKIGHAFVKGLSAVDNQKVIPFSSCELLAYNAKKESGKIAVILDARRDKFYYSLYEKNDSKIGTISLVSLCSFDEVVSAIKKHSQVTVTGDALKRFQGQFQESLESDTVLLPEEDWSAQVSSLAALLSSKENWDLIPSEALVPDYHRITEAEEKLGESK